MNKVVREYLISIAREKEAFAYYSDIVKDCGLEKEINLKTDYGRGVLTKLLSDISEFEDKNKRPLLSSMAIYKDINRNDHGDGFYIVAEKLKKGKFKKLKDDLFGFTEASECRKFWQNEHNYSKYAKIENSSEPINQFSKLFVSLINIEKYQDWLNGWQATYVDFVEDMKELQNNLSKNPNLPLDNNKLYSSLSEPIQTYKAFMYKWLREKANGISSRGQSVMSEEDFEVIVEDSVFKTIAKRVISNPSPTTYLQFWNWWYENESIKNRPLLINRAIAACLPEQLSSTVDGKKFWYVIDIVSTKYNFRLDSDKNWNWFTANIELTRWLDEQLKDELPKVSDSLLERQIWRNIFVWLIYDKYHGKEEIPANTLVRRDPPKDGYSKMPQSNTPFEGQEIDFDEKSRILNEFGDAGEELVMLYEVHELEMKKMFNKAKLVRRAAPGEGFDILSFDERGNEKYIEVKTTPAGWRKPFYLTRHEIKFMRQNKQAYSLYRVYNFDEENNTGEFFELKGNIEDRLLMEPTQYEVVIKKELI